MVCQLRLIALRFFWSELMTQKVFLMVEFSLTTPPFFDLILQVFIVTPMTLMRESVFDI